METAVIINTLFLLYAEKIKIFRIHSPGRFVYALTWVGYSYCKWDTARSRIKIQEIIDFPKYRSDNDNIYNYQTTKKAEEQMTALQKEVL